MCTHTCISHECQEQGSAGTGTQHTRSFIAVGSGANVTAQEEPLSSPRNCPLPHNDSCLVPVGFGSFNNGSRGYSRTLCFVYFHLPHWMCPWFESFIWKKKLRWDAFSQCTLFHGARDWVQGLPIIIRLNIKTGKFWEGKKKKKTALPQDICPSLQHTQFLRSFFSTWYFFSSKDFSSLPSQSCLHAWAGRRTHLIGFA